MIDIQKQPTKGWVQERGKAVTALMKKVRQSNTEVRAAWTLTGACQSVGGVDVQARPSPAVEARAADRLEVAATAKGALPSEQELALQAQVAALQAERDAAKAEQSIPDARLQALQAEADVRRRCFFCAGLFTLIV